MVQIRLSLTVKVIAVELIFLVPHITLTSLTSLYGVFPPRLQIG